MKPTQMTKQNQDETVHMYFMGIKDEVNLYCELCEVKDCENDDVVAYILSLHDKLKKSYAKNKFMKSKVNELLLKNA